MKTFRKLVSVLVLTLVFGSAAFAGQTDSPQCPPPEPGQTDSPPCQPAGNGDSSTPTGSTTGSATDATVTEVVTDVLESMLSIL